MTTPTDTHAWTGCHTDPRSWHGWHWHQRGDVCVVRMSHGLPQVLAIGPQDDWPTWSGAFSII
ncbi:hypothetical protein [Halomonas sp. NO4]|uniref:hypothetical protein n=1 Tax=Halomonas sp. NO4 TaxID=2484813 RepID=UPI0013CF69D7|nr:hypothetical protein [Halomonas sp. NO4]